MLYFTFLKLETEPKKLMNRKTKNWDQYEPRQEKER